MARNRRAKQIEQHERRLRVYELSRRGLSLREIGRELGVSHVTVLNDWGAFWDENPAKDVEKARQEATERLDADYELLGRVIDANLAASLAGDVDASRVVADLVAKRSKLEERRAKVMGLDAPEKKEVDATIVVGEPTPVEVAEKLKQIVGGSAILPRVEPLVMGPDREGER